MKTGPGTLVPPKKGMKAQKYEIEPGTLGIAQNESGKAKHENWI
jgi:hypothetical protein